MNDNSTEAMKDCFKARALNLPLIFEKLRKFIFVDINRDLNASVNSTVLFAVFCAPNEIFFAIKMGTTLLFC
jgi:hypothetical protein